jgi:hypothetical protein
MKHILWLAISLIIIILLCGCGAKPAATVTLNDLISNPQQYNGKTVTVDGIYVSGWESMVLAEDIKFTVNGDFKELSVTGKPIWFAGSLPLDVQNKLYQNTSPTAGLQHFGKVKVTGLFEYGDNYGYGKIYKYRITATKVELLDWTPPK